MTAAAISDANEAAGQPEGSRAKGKGRALVRRKSKGKGKAPVAPEDSAYPYTSLSIQNMNDHPYTGR
jgi:hypothetical protein